MKTIYLLRHAKSSWDDTAIGDVDRPLAKRGRRAAKLMGRHLADNGYIPSQILCSSAARTRQTLEKVQTYLNGSIPTRFERQIYMAEAPMLLRRLKRLSDTLPSVMVVGHNPGLERLADLLIGDGDSYLRQRLAEKYPTCALAVISANIEHWVELAPGCGCLDGLVRPKELEEAKIERL